MLQMTCGNMIWSTITAMEVSTSIGAGFKAP